jgi:hypothetical protein
MAALQNQAGKFVIPDETNAAATLANVELPENLRAFIVRSAWGKFLSHCHLYLDVGLQKIQQSPKSFSNGGDDRIWT